MRRDLAAPVFAPPGAASDAAMPTLSDALDPAVVERRFVESLGHLCEDGPPRLTSINILQYKPGRRCVVEYELEGSGRFPVIGKVRAGRSGRSGLRLLRSLWEAGFDAGSLDSIQVPEPLGLAPGLRMWLQRKAPGRPVRDFFFEPDAASLVRRVAEAARKLHAANVAPKRRHTMEDELRVLHERLPEVCVLRPRLARRVERVLGGCDRLGASTPEPRAPRGIHRDFHPDQVLADGTRISVIDFDLYCEGDPALDVGNFSAHIAETSLRERGDPAALFHLERALEERFVELSGEEVRRSVRVYSTLTLARLVHLSSLSPGEPRHTKDLLDLCEERLGC